MKTNYLANTKFANKETFKLYHYENIPQTNPTTTCARGYSHL